MDSWASFRFFDSSDYPLDKLEGIKFCCASAGHGLLCLCDQNDVFFVDKGDDPQMYTLEGYAIINVAMAKSLPTAIIECQNAQGYHFILFNTQAFNQQGMVSVPNSITSKISCFCSLQDNSKFAILVNPNTIFVYSQPYQLASQARVFNLPQVKITNLLFTQKNDLGDAILYVISEQGIFSICFSFDGNAQQNLIDKTPADSSTVCCIAGKGELYVTRGNNVSLYNEKQKELDFVIEDTPNCIFASRDYLLAAYGTEDTNICKIYHPRTHSVFGRSAKGGSIVAIFEEWGSYLLIARNYSVQKLVQNDLTAKLSQLVHNQQFEVALTIAKSKDMPEIFIADIYASQGEAYLEKNNYDQSVAAYIKTIGFVEPSFVISKFIDTSLTEYLLKYLEALSVKNCATKQHTTLMFNCYTKLRNSQKLRNILDDAIKRANIGLEPLFDVEAATEVLLLSGFVSESLELSHAYHLHAAYVSILLKQKDFETILKYLSEVSRYILTQLLRSYGNDLIDGLSFTMRSELISLIIEQCTVKEDDYLNIRKIQRIFTTHRNEFYTVLRAILEKTPDRMNLYCWNQIIELAMFDPVEDADAEVTKYLTDERATFDNDLVVEMVCISKNQAAREIILKKNGWVEEIIDESDAEKACRICNEFADPDNDILWRRALITIAKKNDPQELSIILKEASKHLTALTIFTVLKGTNATVGGVRNYLSEHFKELYSWNENATKEVNESIKYLSETDEKEKGMREGFFDTSSAYCDFCHETLDIPAKHFLCGHSFHISCLGDNTDFCPLCFDRHKQRAAKRLNNLNEIGLKDGEVPVFGAFLNALETDTMSLTQGDDYVDAVQYNNMFEQTKM